MEDLEKQYIVAEHECKRLVAELDKASEELSRARVRKEKNDNDKSPLFIWLGLRKGEDCHPRLKPWWLRRKVVHMICSVAAASSV